MQEVAQDLTLSSLHIRKQNKNTNLPLLEVDGKTKLTGSLQGGAFYTQTAAGTALTNTTTLTALSTASIPANTLVAGSAIHIFSQGICTSHNADDTITITLKIGNTTIAATAEIAVNTDDIYVIDAWIQIRTIGSSGTFVASGKILDNFNKDEATIDTTQSQDITVNGTWNFAHGDNSVRSDIMIVTIH